MSETSIRRLTAVDCTRLAIGTETAVVLESDLGALESALAAVTAERDAGIKYMTEVQERIAQASRERDRQWDDAQKARDLLNDTSNALAGYVAKLDAERALADKLAAIVQEWTEGRGDLHKLFKLARETLAAYRASRSGEPNRGGEQ